MKKKTDMIVQVPVIWSGKDTGLEIWADVIVVSYMSVFRNLLTFKESSEFVKMFRRTCGKHEIR